MDFDDGCQTLNDINNHFYYGPEMSDVFPGNIYYKHGVDRFSENFDFSDSMTGISSRKTRRQLEKERAIQREKDLALYGRAYVRKRDNANKMFDGLGLDGFIENYGVVAIFAVIFFLLFIPI
ncbi:hypothetical protein [Xenorhabdus sp. TH1]|uniref:hypothetical protein n=1 Tax=Xenorhabdus sp. TH1 TaxID=3130166 RepID=UPI0030CFF0F1